VEEPKTVNEVLRFSKEKLRPEPELKHLKRVCRRRNADGVSDRECPDVPADEALLINRYEPNRTLYCSRDGSI
jgi:hypothetical protein